MRIVAIETATRQASVALRHPDGRIVQRDLDRERPLARILVPVLSDLLREESIEPESLTAIAVSRGPGSFTGLRVGLTAAKTMAFALNLPLIGIPTLQALVQQAHHAWGRIWTVLDGQRGELVTALWQRNRIPGTANDGDRGRELLEGPVLMDRSTWASRLQSADRVMPCELKQPLAAPASDQIFLGRIWTPRAAEVVELAAYQGLGMASPPVANTTWHLPLEYYRPSAAEEHATQRRGEP